LHTRTAGKTLLLVVESFKLHILGFNIAITQQEGTKSLRKCKNLFSEDDALIIKKESIDRPSHMAPFGRRKER